MGAANTWKGSGRIFLACGRETSMTLHSLPDPLSVLLYSSSYKFYIRAYWLRMPHSHPSPCPTPFITSRDICFFDSDCSMSLSRQFSVSKLQALHCTHVPMSLGVLSLEWLRRSCLILFKWGNIDRGKDTRGCLFSLCLVRKTETVQLGTAVV